MDMQAPHSIALSVSLSAAAAPATDDGVGSVIFFAALRKSCSGVSGYRRLMAGCVVGENDVTSLLSHSLHNGE